MSEIFERIPSIIDSVKTPLGFAALVVIALSTLAYLLLPKNGNPYPRLAALAFLAVGFLGLAFVVILFGPGSKTGVSTNQAETQVSTIQVDNKITIGAKNFMESNVLLEMMALVIENDVAYVHVERKYYAGETDFVFDSLIDGDIDLYAEYTGTILTKHLNKDSSIFLDKDYHKRGRINDLLGKQKKSSNIEFLKGFGFDNSFVIVMLKKRYKELMKLGLWPKHGKLNISSLAEATRNAKNDPSKKIKFVFCSLFGYQSRLPDGYKALVADYSLVFEPFVIIDNHEDKLKKLIDKEFDVTDFYSTDAWLDDDKIVTLEDDHPFYPIYKAGPLMRKDFKERNPKIVSALAKLAGKISEKDMIQLNRKLRDEGVKASELSEKESDIDRKDPHKKLRDIVRKFLDDKEIL